MGRPKKRMEDDIDSDFEDDTGESRAVQLTVKKLQDTAKTYAAKKQKMDDVRAEIGALMNDFQESGGNNQAFKTANRIAGMEDIKAQTFLRDLHMYLTELGVYKQLDMLDEVPDLRPHKSAPIKTASTSEGAAAH